MIESKLLAENGEAFIELFKTDNLFFVLETKVIDGERHVISASDKLSHNKAKEIFDNLCKKNFKQEEEQ